MKNTNNEQLNAREVQAAISFILQRACSQTDAEKGAIAAAVSVTLATRGAADAVERLRDLADEIEQCLVLPSSGVMQ